MGRIAAGMAAGYTSPPMFDPNRFIHARARAVDASGIRRVFDLAAKLKTPVNFSIGQPDFDVPQPVKDAAIAAIEKGLNRYTVTQGMASLHEKVTRLISAFRGPKSALAHSLRNAHHLRRGGRAGPGAARLRGPRR
jgi:hypothetical protein